ncbi:hypothetical protein [Azospirillum endophyticum]
MQAAPDGGGWTWVGSSRTSWAFDKGYGTADSLAERPALKATPQVAQNMSGRHSRIGAPTTRYWGHYTKVILSSGMGEHGENAGAPALTKVRFAGFSPAKPGFNLQAPAESRSHTKCWSETAQRLPYNFSSYAKPRRIRGFPEYNRGSEQRLWEKDKCNRPHRPAPQAVCAASSLSSLVMGTLRHDCPFPLAGPRRRRSPAVDAARQPDRRRPGHPRHRRHGRGLPLPVLRLFRPGLLSTLRQAPLTICRSPLAPHRNRQSAHQLDSKTIWIPRQVFL